ncbi:GTPase ObgE [Gloeomargarita lithophora Alchichica-D10]|uniref:GTPase Obg n=1 Tax=Gloeomargarita lithophora Alchichica-D10 TaxID=1188229 RepID=A0A1J0AGU2_9CYAN|nr:GTPase ObgE [Gloeomargarita lithophora]APB35158.1 GTPase ObgE [Gloeomargarita lithophora Alchichica-D10]
MQLIDQAEITVQGGKGGDGIVAFRREKYVPAGGPAGGNGGKGGDVLVQAQTGRNTLLDFRYQRHFQAEDGQRGGPSNCTGAGGKDRVIPIPCGTLITDADSGALVADVVTPGQTLVIAKGGKGGLGNRHFLSNHNRAPDYALAGLAGEFRHLRLELKLLAEVGIVGLPNAGKSTLISRISAAKPKIADYPFTTLVPNLGVVANPQGDGTVFADIPGLIAGAHAGVGLGYDFLRHIERTRLLIHLLDSTAPDPVGDYQAIRDELAQYIPQLGQPLTERPELIVLNKLDALSDVETIEDIVQKLSIHNTVCVISAVTGAGVTAMLQQVWQRLELTADPVKTAADLG